MKRSIAVIGVLPQQARIIEDRCRGKRVRLKFPRSAEIPAADQVIVWTNFVHHRVQEAAIAKVGRDRVRLFAGGMKALGDLVEETVEKAVA